MKCAKLAFAAGLMLAVSGQAAFAGETVSHRKPSDCAFRDVTPAGREALDEGVTHVAIQAAFHPSDDQQRLLSLLILLSTPSEGAGRTR